MTSPITSVKTFFANAKNILKFENRKAAKQNADAEIRYFKQTANMNRIEIAIGTVLRCAVAFCTVFGLALTFFDAVGIYRQNADFRQYSLPLLPLALVSAALCAMSGFAPYSKLTKVLFPTGAALFYIGLPAVLYGNPLKFYSDALRLIWNESVECIAQRRFTSFSHFTIGKGYSFDTETLMLWGAFAAAAILSLLAHFSFWKKTRPAVLAVTYFAVLFPIFIFNLPSTNTGFALSAAAVFGFIALRSCDRRLDGTLDLKIAKRAAKRQKRKEAKENTAKRKLGTLKIKSAADIIYNQALEAGMTEKKARAASRSVTLKLRKKARADEKKLAKENAVAKRTEKKKAKERKLRDRRKMRETAKELKSKSANLSYDAKARKEVKEAKKERKKQTEKDGIGIRAASGFAGGIALVLALLAVWIPAATVKKSFKTVDFINERVKDLRSLTDDILMSDDVDLTRGDLYSSPEVFDYETLTFDEREYDGTLIYYVESSTTDSVYLKTRTALDFNFSSDTWLYADNEKVIETSREFDTGFSPDDLTSSALALLYPGSENVPDKGEVNAFSETLKSEQIHLMRVNGKSKLLAVPSVMNTSVGLLTRGTAESAEYVPTSYFDGIYTSRHYGKDSGGYSTVSYVYDMKNADIGGIFDSIGKTYDALSALAEKYKRGSDSTELKEEYKSRLSGCTVYYGIGEDFVDNFTDEERDALEKLLKDEVSYREWVNENYLKTSGNEEIANLSASLVEGKETVHGKVKAVVGYLTSDEFTYTLEPSEKADGEKTVLENFLFETKEGYCSHFATAAVLLLREAGIPARYAEGYIARGFFEGYGNNKVAKYTSNVFDENSHTWVEVYFDGIGWVPYETTPLYAAEIYGASLDSADVGDGENESGDDGENAPLPDSQRPIETMPVVIPDSEEETEPSPLERFKGLIIAVGIIILVITAYRIVRNIIVKKSDVYVKRKYDCIADAKNEAVYRDKSRDKKEIEKFLNDSILTVLKVVGIGPETGELSEEFGERLATEYGGMSGKDARFVMSCIRKSEFGGELTFGELSDVAEYLADITVSLYSGLSPIKKLELRYFRHLI